jgi:phospholipid/cholesterol/gamma-HCH transport system substrate-binding protein
VLSALADGLRGQGERIGEATSAANEVLLTLNTRSDAVRDDWRSLKAFSDTYDAAATDIVSSLDALGTTSETITNHATQLDALLLNSIGLSQAGISLLAPNQKNFVDAVNTLEPTTALLLKYNPTLTCMLVGAKKWYDNSISAVGGNGRTAILDAALLLANDPYTYPDNLPVVAAKGGPGGKPSCGSLPDVSKRFPVRQLVTNTGWGTGLDIRPNPGIGHPFFANYFPVTKAMPAGPHYYGLGPPAPGPIPYPGAPPYGAPLYGPGGVPLWPGIPSAPPSSADSAPPPSAPTQAEAAPPPSP